MLGLPFAGRAGGGGDDDDDLKSNGRRKSGGAGLAFPFRRLRTDAGARVVEVTAETVLFWEEAQAAMAYETSSPFVVRDGAIVDDGTGSVWAIDGRAIEGPRRGERLGPVPAAHVASWSAWSDFDPGTDVWSP